MTVDMSTPVANRRRVSRWAATALALVAVGALGACGDSSDDPSTSEAAGAEPCALLTPEITAEIEDGMAAVLAGSELVGAEPDGGRCVQRFTAGEQFVELTYADATGEGDEGLSPVSEDLLTNGVDTSRVLTDGGSVDVVATSSDPAAISTWDASLVGAGALAPG